MNSTLLIYKEAGETPLQAINKVRKLHPSLAQVKVSMAGRLDPMAEGLLLLLIGDENKKRSHYENLYKEYEFSTVFGIETDSYDGLGIIKSFNSTPLITSVEINNTLRKYIGKTQQAFPPFSSKPYKGKPLYYWSRQEEIDEKNLPSKEITISHLSLLSLETITIKTIAENIITRINSIHGNFRQEKIVPQWNNINLTEGSKNLFIAKLKITCSSGTYVRGIAHELGKQFTTGAFSYSIKRTKIGELTQKDLDYTLTY